jgi:8-oxo-dGTP pyrophosphatase MutT (NUDIX family)
MKPNKVRAIAICVFRDSDRIFVAEGHDPVKNQAFYRPLGGTIEFGERGYETVVRELLEEIGAEIKNVRYLGTVENVFTYNGKEGHEIVLVYDGDFADRAMYDQTKAVTAYDDGEVNFQAIWKRLDEFGEGAPLYPDGLMELLAEE